MATPPKPIVVTVDEAAAKRADEALERELDAEVQRRMKESPTMEAATQAALVAAQKQATDAISRADASDKTAKEALEAVKRIEEATKARADEASKSEAVETLRRARFLADHRGAKGDALDAEAKRLAALGRAAVDELLSVTPAPTADPIHAQMRGAPSADGKASKMLVSPSADGKTTAYTVNDPSLTVPGYKPRPSLGGGA